MSGYAGLLRMYVRRDWWQIALWATGITFLFYSQAPSIESLYPTQAEFDAAAKSMEGNAAFIAMAGPARALNTVGGQVFWQGSAFGAVLVGLMSMFLVGRHTRAEEESGRDELLRSLPVGRHAPVAATATVVLIANMLTGVLLFAALASFGLAVGDSFATGLGLTVVGLVFTAFALVGAQLTVTTRAMYGLVGAVIGAAYVLRAVGDVGASGLSWLSPIGWYQAVRPFSGLRWWPLGLSLLAVALLACTAATLIGRRDLGAGVLPPRPGPARGALGSPLGLAWRLQRGSVIGWTVGLTFVGLSYGSIGDQAGDIVGDSEASQEIFGRNGADLVDGFYATSALMIGLLAAGFVVSSALRLRGEEAQGRSENVLATATSRPRWFAAHLVVALSGAAVVLLAAAVGIGVGYLLTSGDVSRSVEVAVPVAQQIAPLWVCGAVALLIVAVAPRLATGAWVVVGFAAVALLLGGVLQFPQWLLDLSPYEHLAATPAEPFAWVPWLALLGVAALSAVAAKMAYARRDIG